MSTSTHPPMGDLARDIGTAKILVTTGSGGVGKTTTAAAIGLAGARYGRRTLVLTIDPARRLAQAMGIDDLGDDPQQVAIPDLPPDGELWAMMLDMKTTFDRLIDRHAPTAEAAATIKANRIYRTLSGTLAGTQEYMAMERLHELHEAGGWDLLVIDTPPTRSALDFLDAPDRMGSFMEGRLLQLLIKPGKVAGRGIGRVVGAGTSAFMRVAGRVTGMELIEDLGEFFRNFDGMYDGFKQRADQVLALLRDPGGRFVVVTSPDPPPLREARYFLERLEQEGLHAAGLVVNRILPQLPRDPSDAQITRIASGGDRSLEGRAVSGSLQLLRDVRDRAARQHREVSATLYGVHVPVRVDVPLLGDDVHDLDGLTAIADALTNGKGT